MGPCVRLSQIKSERISLYSAAVNTYQFTDCILRNNESDCMSSRLLSVMKLLSPNNGLFRYENILDAFLRLTNQIDGGALETLRNTSMH